MKIGVCTPMSRSFSSSVRPSSPGIRTSMRIASGLCSTTPINPVPRTNSAALLSDFRGRLPTVQVSRTQGCSRWASANPDVGVPAIVNLEGDDFDPVTAVVGLNDHRALPTVVVRLWGYRQTLDQGPPGP